MKTKKLLLVLAMVSLSLSLFSQKWIVQHSGLPASQNPTLIFSAVSPNVCWGIQYETNNPKCILTTDGGNNWKPVNLQGISGLTGLSSSCIFALDSETAWITLDDPVGINGGIYKTSNGGTDWVKQESSFAGTGAFPRGIHFFDANNGLCTGNPRNGYWEIYTTIDGGTNWTRVPKTNIPISNTDDFIFNGEASGNSYWFTSINNGVYRTTDKGLTWKNATTISTEIAFRDEMNGLGINYFANLSNKLYATSDGGESWTQRSSAPLYPSAYFITCVPGTSGTYFVTSTSNIGYPEPTKPGSAYTMDNGEHWTVVDSLAHGPATFTTGNVGWSAGNGDIIYKWVADTYTDIVPAGSTVKKLSSDQFIWTRGPVWYNNSVLLFSDDFLPGSGPDIYQYDPISQQISTWPTNASHCGGLSCDTNGNLIGASSKILRMNNSGQVTKIIAAIYNDKPFDNPIDLIADDKGGVYFSDPDYFLTTPPQDKTAVYYVSSTGNVKRVIDDLAKPNGLVLSPDGTKLYVVDTENKYLYSWDVASDGSVSGKVTLAELQTKAGAVIAGAIGMAIDKKGNIYVATDIGIQVFSPQGAAITTIVIPETPTDCDFGGSNFKTLYITAYHPVNSNFVSNIYSIDLNYEGYAVSRKTSFNDGISQIPNKPMVGIYPNPVTDMLHIKLNEGIKVKAIEILNTVGKIESISLKSLAGTDVEINTQNLKPGIYLLRIDSDGGIVSGKFIKK